MLDAPAAQVSDATVLLVAYSELFDLRYYMDVTGREFGSVRDAARDYCERGWQTGLNPSRRFDTKFYLRVNEDVRVAGVNPLEHYLRDGMGESRLPRVGHGELSDPPRAPQDGVWAQLEPVHHRILPKAVGIDVVVPVYRGYDDTLACLYSALTASSQVSFELVVINDCSPEARLAAKLRELAGLGLIRLIENAENQGFVGSANTGLFLNADRDVVLLNADTVVYDGWLDRLAYHGRLANTGTVTPLSNNATIMSYPATLENNNCDLEVSHAGIDQICAEQNQRQSIDVPTGVGFCFYVRRDLLNAIGGFNAEAFGKGYGEENDFCLRAAKAGWRNLAALDVYVRHTGEVSFSSSATAAKSIGGERLLELHPEYNALVEAFIASDPMRPAREAIDMVRLGRLNAGRGVMFVDHGWIGGILRHLNELTAALGKEDVVVTRLAPTDGGAKLQLTSLTPLDLPNLPCVDAGDEEAIGSLLRSMQLAFVHIHSLVAHRLENFERLLAGIRAAGLRYRLTIHDYAPVCPRITMVDWGGSYCASPSTTHCRTCIAKVGTEFGKVDIDDWRAAYGQVVDGAETVIVPDPDVEARLRRYVPIKQSVRVRPHQVWVSSPEKARRIQSPANARERTIGVIGAIGPHKGSGVLLAMAGDITSRNLPLRIKIYGYTDRIEFDQFDCVELTGRYREGEIERIVRNNPCDLVFLPSVCPETYSFTLDTALAIGIHPVCFDIGAAARRLRRFEIGTVLPLSLVYDVQALNDTLMMIGPETVSLKALGADAWWGSLARYYGEAPPIDGQLRAAELQAAQ
jgi:GT2 family glycosyltransferase/glycosyltransferase involved in cell wall biosynthesis